MPERIIRLMEVCGTHTMAIAKSGLRSLLPKNVKLLSGPGCPVCVTPPEAVDLAVKLAMQPGFTICTYGDMLRVPGTVRGTGLLAARGQGASVEMVFSPMDALEKAVQHPEREVVFLGVGFETTAPGTLAAIRAARERKIPNFSVLMLLKRTPPAIRALLADSSNLIDGFICPGHVAVITGSQAFRFLPEEYGKPAVVSGFEPAEIWLSVKELLRQVQEQKPRLVNNYPAVVRAEGNRLAQELMQEMTHPADSLWRGLGRIPDSGFALQDEYAAYDACARFGLSLPDQSAPTACRCGEVLCGKMPPRECPFFGTACTPEDPLGPCMVSGEGSCAAEYKYG